MTTRKESTYGYTVNQIVTNKIDLTNENGVTIPTGTRLRIVAIAPKVRIYTENNDLYDMAQRLDSKQYFFNAVLEDQQEDYSNRIRANFCTIRNVKSQAQNRNDIAMLKRL